MPLMDIGGDDPQVIVDLSNVCRDESLGAAATKATWDRFVRVMKAWRDQIEPSPQGVAIADENLRFLFSGADRREFELAERSGLVRTVSGAADHEILRWAERSGAAVLSKDRFVGHRRQHPWIEGAVGRFFAWETDHSGMVRITARDMGVAAAYSLSRGEEADLLKERGLDPRRPSDRELLTHAFRCTNRDCLTARFSPDRLLVPPARKQHQPVCPGCGRALEDLGPRPGAIEIVIEAGERELARKVVEDGGQLTLGRADVPNERGAEAARDFGRVSRAHIGVSVERSRLRICDLESRNGTSIARWDSVARTFTEPEPLAAGERVELGHRDVAILADVLRVRRSGQQFAARPSAASHDAPAASTMTDSEDQA